MAAVQLCRLFSIAVFVGITTSVRASEFCHCDLTVLNGKVEAVIREGKTFAEDIKALKKEITELKSQISDLKKSSCGSLKVTRKSIVSHDEGQSQNVTNITTTDTVGEMILRNLSKEVADFQEDRRTIKNDLEKEKRIRRSLEDDIVTLKSEINKTKTLKEAMDTLQKDVEDLATPTRNLSTQVNDLLADREKVRKELMTEKEMRIALENKLIFLEMEVNETELLKLNIDGLRNKLAELEANVTYENLDEMIEVRFAHLSEITNHTVLKQRLDILEYKVEVQQEVILGDDVNNVTTNISLSNRLERLEKEIFNERNDTEELIDRIRDQIDFVNNSVVEEINNSVKTVLNESKVLTTRLDDLQSDVRCINASLIKQLDVGDAFFVKESNHSVINTDISLLKQTIQELNKSMQEQIVESEKQNTTLRALLAEMLDLYNNSTAEINDMFIEWKQKINQSTTELIANVSYETNDAIDEFVKETRKEGLQVKEKLETFAEIILNLEDDFKLNFSLVNSKLKTINEEMSKNSKSLAKIHKMELAINNSASKDDLKHITERFVPISVNLSRLSGQMEDVRHQYVTLDYKIIQVKDWAVKYINNERKAVEKQLRNLEERIRLDINTTVLSRVSSTRRELEAMIDKQQEIISRLVNQSNRNESLSITDVSLDVYRPCPHLTDIDPNVIITYEGKTYVPKGRLVSHGGELIFRCIHIGRYLLKGYSSIQCENGRWSENVPICIKLPDEDDFEKSLLDQFKCPSDFGKYKHPSDCNKYYECKTNTKRLLQCPPTMKFDSKTGFCIHSHLSDCYDIPAIEFEPEIGLPNNPMAISPNGSLVVYPGVNIALDCISPIIEEVQWMVKRGEIGMKFKPEFFGDKKTRLQLKSVTEAHSGEYSCIKNMEKIHTITIIVKAIECPAIQVEPPLIMTPSIESNMKLSSRLHFSCKDNYNISGVSLLTCMTTGNWSHDVPTCVPKGCVRPNTTNDPWIKLKPDLEIYSPLSKVKLECLPGAPAKSIYTSVRCGEDGQWMIMNYSTFPTCLG